MIAKFEGHTRDEPFVPCNAGGIWVEPQFICRILYKEWDASVGLIEPKFDGIIQEVVTK